mgnify:CR=1 FL=1|jgi:hypothetical protein
MQALTLVKLHQIACRRAVGEIVALRSFPAGQASFTGGAIRIRSAAVDALQLTFRSLAAVASVRLVAFTRNVV